MRLLFSKNYIALVLGCSILACALFFYITQAQDSSAADTSSQTSDVYEHIQSFNSDIVVHTDSSIDVTETIVYDFGDQEKHGIFRDIPLTKAAGTIRKLKIENVSVKDEKGTPYTIDNISSGDPYEIKVGDADTTITGVHTYVIHYTVQNAVGYFDDRDEIYWNLTGNDWEVPMTTISGSVSVPTVLAEEVLHIANYCGENGAKNVCGDTKVTTLGAATRVDFSSTEYGKPTDEKNSGFDSGEGMTVAVGFPKGIVAEIPLTLWEKPMTYVYVAWGIFAIGLLFFLIWLLGVYLPKVRAARRPIIAEYEPPRRMSPSEVGLVKKPLLGMGTIASADILYLATQGYITITDSDVSPGVSAQKNKKKITLLLISAAVLVVFGLMFGPFFWLFVFFVVVSQLKTVIRFVRSYVRPRDFKFTRTQKPLATEKKHLHTLYEIITKEGTATTIQDIEDAKPYYDFLNYNSEVTAAVSNDQSVRIRRVFSTALTLFLFVFKLFGFGFCMFFVSIFLYQKYGVEFTPYYILNCALPFVILIALSSVPGILKRRLKIRTELWYSVMGLAEYIRVAEKDRIKFLSNPEDSQRIFLTLLPYAVALEMEQRWVRVFADITMTPPDWYHSSNSFSSGMLISSIGSLSSSVSSTSTVGAPVSSSSSSGSSSGSSGGGSSGGGGGGGGGGSW